MPKKLFDILACPVCKHDLDYDKDRTGLICRKCHQTYPIKGGIPILLPPEK
ncbi:MAG: Trm112 family protein [archaeon]